LDEAKEQLRYCDIQCLNDTPSTLKKISTVNPIFICVISYTETSQIPGITMAGANSELIKYTSAADSEFLYYGRCKCINKVPATPDGKPTPGIITRSALQLGGIPFLIVDAGSKIKPSIPYFTFSAKPGNNIRNGNAVRFKDVKKLYDYGFTLGVQLAKTNDLVIVGESIAGGTTTALGVMIALGIDAKFKVSSSMPRNPHRLKNSVISEAMERSKVHFGDLRDEPFKAISLFGDPMMPSVAGIASGVITSGSRIMLAGGTQMSAIAAILTSLHLTVDNVSIATTCYVAEDSYSNLVELMRSVSNDIPIYSCNLHLAESAKPGLQAFARGYVKEGVGAGGTSIVSMLKSNGRINGTVLLKAIEQDYETVMEKVLLKQ
jgi:uncharacterized protein (TIGR00303 family)